MIRLAAQQDYVVTYRVAGSTTVRTVTISARSMIAVDQIIRGSYRETLIVQSIRLA